MDTSISPSGIALYLQCPRKFYYKATGVKPIEVAWEESAEFGKLVHQIIARYYSIIPNSLVPKEIPLYLSRALRSITTDSSDKLLKHMQGFIKFESQRLSWSFSTKPIAIEQEFSKPPLHGVVDAVFKKKDKVVVVDWKTGYGWNPRLNDTYRIQGAIYQYLTDADEVYFVYVKYGKIIELKREDIKMVINKIKAAIKGIKSNKFDRNIGEHCSSCEYQIACKLEQEGLKWWEIIP